ncbi:Trypanosomal VSG domain containing protein [Trypanosoma brucei equiperdum]|uniref:Trypanosomal VSG domain containing protein n=1 Tax=Trypanosoma brucei equiperdum TaxID=630700 RepID=A0A3L6LCI0_9TRYP|nr:Trypanosomal VSG domain containing protein [Trypanosoma brucei equiperdum]
MFAHQAPVPGEVANVGPGDNAVSFKALCELISIGEASLSLSDGRADVSSDVDKILALNMSVSPEQWHKMVDNVDSGDDTSKIKTKAKLSTQAVAEDFANL